MAVQEGTLGPIGPFVEVILLSSIEFCFFCRPVNLSCQHTCTRSAGSRQHGLIRDACISSPPPSTLVSILIGLFALSLPASRGLFRPRTTNCGRHPSNNVALKTLAPADLIHRRNDSRLESTLWRTALSINILKRNIPLPPPTPHTLLEPSRWPKIRLRTAPRRIIPTSHTHATGVPSGLSPSFHLWSHCRIAETRRRDSSTAQHPDNLLAKPINTTQASQ